MICITGDTHGEQARLLCPQGPKTPRAGDHLIICGDFGFIFRDNYAEKMFLKDLEQLPYTILFVDGNHENFEALGRYPVELWQGGKVHRIGKNILHLMRGQVFTIEGKTFFTFGGAYSRDRWWRERNISYWEEELPSDADYKEADRNLTTCDYAVDYVLTHTAPREVILRRGYIPDPHEAELNGFLEYLYYRLRFGHWYCGHFHEDAPMGDNFTFLHYDMQVL